MAGLVKTFRIAVDQLGQAMSIAVSCDSCGARYAVKSAAAGRKIRCRQCGEIFKVPPADAAGLVRFQDIAELDDEFDAEPVPSRLPRRAGKSRGRSTQNSVSLKLPEWVTGCTRALRNISLLTVILSLYAFAVVVTAFAPNGWKEGWTNLSLFVGFIGLVVFIVGNIWLFGELVWQNIWVIFLLPLLPFVGISVLFWNSIDADTPKRIVLYGALLLGLALPPHYLAEYAHLLPDFANRQGGPAPVNFPQPLPGSNPQPFTTAGSSRDLFRVADVPLPSFLDFRAPRQTPSGVTFYEVLTQPAQGGDHPGSTMRMRLYLPRANVARGSLGCVLVGPAGSNLISGKPLDDVSHEAETTPYVQAGLAVVHFSLDGPVDDLGAATDITMAAAYRQFSAALAGLVNARNAMAFVLQRVPEVDPRRIYIAGHSSAGTLALLFAEHEPSLRGCIAYAPAVEIAPRLRDVVNDRRLAGMFPNLATFVERSAPVTHVGTLSCPVFLFHGVGDTNTSFAQSATFTNTANAQGKSVTLSQVPDADHYQAMAVRGVPLAIEWLRTKFGEPGK